MIIDGSQMQVARSEALELALKIVEGHLDNYAPGRRLLRRLLFGALRERVVSLEIDQGELDVLLEAQAQCGR